MKSNKANQTTVTLTEEQAKHILKSFQKFVDAIPDDNVVMQASMRHAVQCVFRTYVGAGAAPADVFGLFEAWCEQVLTEEPTLFAEEEWETADLKHVD